MYETAGVERQSMVCHLVVDKNATDPAAEMFEDFKKLTKGMLQITINVDYRLYLNLTQKIVNLLYKSSECLASNATYFSQLRQQLAKTSTPASQTQE